MFYISIQLFCDNNKHYHSDKYVVKLLRTDENEAQFHEGSLFLFYRDHFYINGILNVYCNFLNNLFSNKDLSNDTNTQKYLESSYNCKYKSTIRYNKNHMFHMSF